MICSYCNKERTDHDAVVATRRLVNSKERVRSGNSPGGQYYDYADGTRLLLAGQCDNCDLMTAREFLNE